MGENYYLRVNESCPTCRILGTKLHIGKVSFGWCFALHVYPESFLNSWESWKPFLETWPGQIEDEYGGLLQYKDVVYTVERRRGKNKFNQPYPGHQSSGYGSWEDYHEGTGTLSTKYGLLRRKLDDRVIAHGHGPWDCVTGDFE